MLATEGQVLALLKPLFEVESAEARRSGQVGDPALLVAALHSVLSACATAGLLLLGAAKLALQPQCDRILCVFLGVMQTIHLYSKMIQYSQEL